MSYKKMKDGSLKIRSNLKTEVNLFNFLSLINEVDLYTEWIPFCKKAFIVISDEASLKILVISQKQLWHSSTWESSYSAGKCASLLLPGIGSSIEIAFL